MVNYVEVNPGDAANAANRLLNASADLQNDDAPPDPDSVGWGDDQFGEWMRSEYLKNVDDGPCLPDRCVEEKHNIGGKCGELGEGIHQAMHGFELQEMVNTHLMETSFDESQDSQSGSGSTGGSSGGGSSGGGSSDGGSSDGGTAPATTTPLSSPVPTSQESDGGPSTRGVKTVGRMYRTLQAPGDQEQPTDEPSPGVMVVGRMYRTLQQPDDQQPESLSPDQGDHEDPERRVFMRRLLLSFPDPADGSVSEESTESSERDGTEPASGAEPGGVYRARWLIDPTDDTTTESPPESESETDAGTDRVYRARWMARTLTDGQPHPTDESTPQE